MSAQRVLALLALRARPTRRSNLAGVLWPDNTEARAQANLRAALWRLGRLHAGLIESDGCALALEPTVRTDYDEFWAWSERAINGRARLSDMAIVTHHDGWLLLPDWYDDWIDVERERIRQRWLHALESLAVELIGLRRYAQALDVSLTAVAVDPLRETAHRAVMLAHLGERNVGEARRQYERCHRRFEAELGITPSRSLAALLDSHRSGDST